MKDFSNKLKYRLKEIGMTQGELCEKIGMTANGLRKAIEHNSLQVSTVEAISKALETNIGYFIEIETKPTGMWQRLLDEANTEAQRWKMRAFELEEKFSVGNFQKLSKYVNSFFCLQH
ncbi:Cro/C1-type helix-turn-helix DNA-binding protein [Arcicella aurantiaca]|uniref:Cro/C1-type helix-turn-helix DNA-binding protein n=1 Tax=Arcicella aurantiaca TaxID=591202 RepID=A0A316ECW6_9BACT|nr:helix-turn-helix transcriptional regulator [Arcicella aurantiaca]PWK27215.1 Cro/C1-type helix-turn-helix DNA-binding protein [Arcicella aurantiaca]